METLHSKVIGMLKKECGCLGSISAYMKHIIVSEDDARSGRRRELKQEITELISQHFPEREELLPFTLTGQGLKDEHFRIERMLTPKKA